VTAYDAAGNFATDTLGIAWTDQTEPVIESIVNVPLEPDHLESTEVRVEASDNVDVTRVTIEWPDIVEPDDMMLVGGVWTYTIDGLPAETVLPITVTAYDAAGNFATDTLGIAWTDQTPPEMTVVTDPEPPLNEDESLIVQVTATDNVGVTEVWISYGSTNEKMTHVGGNLWTHAIPAQPGGTILSITITVSDAADNTATTTFTVEWLAPVEATIDFKPDTLEIDSTGKWVTVYIELPAGYDVNDIDLTTVTLNGQVYADPKPVAAKDYDHDGIPDLKIKFDRADVQGTLDVGDAVDVTVKGKLYSGRVFEGTDTIRVIE
jgi:hypothetical protein